jgi:hypothetical protein
MRLFVATFRLIEEDPEIFLATTIEKAIALLTNRMKEHLVWIGYGYGDDPIPDDYQALETIGFDEEYYYIDINSHKVHSDGHILKHIMETL